MSYDNEIAAKLIETEKTIEAKKIEIETEYNKINSILENLKVQEDVYKRQQYAQAAY